MKIHKLKKRYILGCYDIVNLCNQAISFDLNKVSDTWNNVTCKNCLKQKEMNKIDNKNR